MNGASAASAEASTAARASVSADEHPLTPHGVGGLDLVREPLGLVAVMGREERRGDRRVPDPTHRIDARTKPVGDVFHGRRHAVQPGPHEERREPWAGALRQSREPEPHDGAILPASGTTSAMEPMAARSARSRAAWGPPGLVASSSCATLNATPAPESRVSG